MKTIWKFSLPVQDEVSISVPLGAEIIHVGTDPRGEACLWCEVEPGKTWENITLFVIGTGNPMPAQAVRHWGSFVDGPFVWHVYSA